MKGKLFVMSLAAVLLGGAFVAAMPTEVISSSAAECNVEYSYWAANVANDPEASTGYECTNLTQYTATEAAAAGVPAGYEGNVIKIDGDGTRGFIVDFSAAKIPQALINSFSIRYYIEAGAKDTASEKYPQLRIPMPTNPAQWAYQKNEKDVTGEWATKEFNSSIVAKLCQDGYFGKFQIAFRSEAGSIPFYVDSITVNLKANDGVGPTITYGNGGSTITMQEDTLLQKTATAYDAQEKRDVPVTYTLGDDTQYNEDGTLKAGNWTLTLSAEDYYGNKTEKVFTLNVKAGDKTKPVISTNIQTMYAKVGAIPMFDITATDDSGSVTVQKTWSAGALDSKGRLTEGTHTYTITATDMFGNVATHVITVIVSADGGLGDNYVDEQGKYDEWLEEQEMAAIRVVQNEVVAKLDVYLSMYSASSYSEANYALILEAYEAAKAGIYSETEKSKMEKWHTVFIMNAEEVKTLAQEGQTPTVPDEPVTPDEPVEPDTPVTPDEPVEPDTPVTPDEPVEPDTPVTPENPDTPNKPSEEKGGCGGTMASLTAIAVMAATAAFVCKKKED